MARLFRLIFYLAVALLAVIFAVLNSQPAPFNYYFGKTSLPLALMLAIAIAFGAVLGIVATMGMVVKSKRQASAMRRNAANAEKELTKLRALPHQDQV